MHIIKVWCLPKMNETSYKTLWGTLLAAAKTVPELGIENEHDVLILFPADNMEWGLGSEVLVEVDLGSMLLQEDREELASALVKAVRQHSPDIGTVVSKVPRYDPSTTVRSQSKAESTA